MTTSIVFQVGDRRTVEIVRALVAGKKADILVLDANRLQDLRNTEKIHSPWLEGVEVPR